MMKKYKTTIAALAAAAALFAVAATPVHASVIFSDDFEGVTAGASILNWDGGVNWNVPGAGSVDLVRSGDYGINCSGGGGYCVDMDGSSNSAGDLLSINLGPLAPGNYRLTYDLSGNQRQNGFTDTVETFVEFAGFSWHQSLAYTAGWQTFTREFTLTSVTNPMYLRFAATGWDNIGMMLDNVRLAAVPEPGTLGLLGAGLIALGFGKRRRA